MKQLTFKRSTSFEDGTPMTQQQIAALTFTAMIDSKNPPVTSFPVPTAAVAAANGDLITVTFVQLGFVPAPGTAYFADVVETSGGQTSKISNVANWTEAPQIPLAVSQVAVS